MLDDVLEKESHAKLETEDDASTRVPSLYNVSRPSSRPESLARSTKEDVEPPPSQDAPPQDTTEYPNGFRLAAIIVALVASVFLIALDMTIIATAIPRITDEFHSLDQVGWYGSAFFLTLASFQSTWGKAYKYFPLKTAFLIAILVFEIGSLICGVAQNSITLIVGRAIAGAGGGGIASGAYTIVAFSAPPTKRPAYTGILGATCKTTRFFRTGLFANVPFSWRG